MIDEKKIEEAQEEIYEDRFLFNGEDIYFDNDDREEMYYSGQIKEAIKLGANWALEQFLKDLWHDASEKPTRGKLLLTQSVLGIGTNKYKYEVETATHVLDYCRENPLYRWLYIDDLLPK